MIAPLAALIRLHELQTVCSDTPETQKREESRLLQSLSPDVLRHYGNAQRRYGMSAVVPMHKRSCSGCHVRQPAVLPELAEDVHECQHCGRLLYDPDVAYELSVG